MIRGSTRIGPHNSLTVTVKCKDGYLLVPQNGSSLECDRTTGKWTIPTCEGRVCAVALTILTEGGVFIMIIFVFIAAIPSVKFAEKVTSVDMRDEKKLRLEVVLTCHVVRKFSVNAKLSHESATSASECV